MEQSLSGPIIYGGYAFIVVIFSGLIYASYGSAIERTNVNIDMQNTEINITEDFCKGEEESKIDYCVKYKKGKNQ